MISRFFFRLILVGAVLYTPIHMLKVRQLKPVGGWKSWWGDIKQSFKDSSQ